MVVISSAHFFFCSFYPSFSEFEELEAVPTSAVIEGPLEPSVNPTISSVQPEDSSFENFFSVRILG